MSKGLTRYKNGDWNTCRADEQQDGSYIITISSRKRADPDVFRVRGLNTPREEELDVATGNPINQGDRQGVVPGVQKEAAADGTETDHRENG